MSIKYLGSNTKSSSANSLSLFLADYFDRKPIFSRRKSFRVVLIYFSKSRVVLFTLRKLRSARPRKSKQLISGPKNRRFFGRNGLLTSKVAGGGGRFFSKSLKLLKNDHKSPKYQPCERLRNMTFEIVLLKKRHWALSKKFSPKTKQKHEIEKFQSLV